MYVFIVSIICAVMLGTVRQMVYPDLIENIVLTFLLFVAIDSGLRAIMGRDSWAVKLVHNRTKGEESTPAAS